MARSTVSDDRAVWSARRNAIRRWLAEKSPPLEELFVSAVKLMHDPSFPGRVVLISHAVRDIGNRLPDAVSGIKSERLDYAGRMDRLAKSWRRSAPNAGFGPAAGAPARTTGTIPLDARIVADLEELISEHEAARRRPDESAMRLYAGFTPTNARRREELRPAIDLWVKVTRWFVARAHAGKKTDADHDFDEVIAKFELFETALGAMAQSFYETVAGIDEILKSPTPERVEQVLAMLGHAEQVRYLFDKLEDPSWVGPLHANGLFARPPPPDEDAARKTIGFPMWPQSRYLARMAARAEVQVLVLQIALSIETTNVRIHEDLADVALALPASQSARFVSRAEGWLRSRYQILLPEKLGELVAHLASGGEHRAALRLARSLLRVVPDSSKNDNGPSDGEVRLSPKPRARFDVHSYQRVLQQCLPPLANATRLDALRLAAELLAKAVKLSLSHPEDREDYSWIWRKRIDDSDDDDVRDLLVSAVRDVAAQLAREHHLVRDVVELLEGNDWSVFRRIALWVLAQDTDGARDLIAGRIGNRTLFEDRHYWREYSALAKKGFSGLEPTTRDLVLGWIEAGPDLEEYARSREQWMGTRPTPEEQARFADLWRRTHMSPLADALPQPFKATFDSLVERCGAPQEEDSDREMAEWTGSRTSKAAHELRSMSAEEFVAFAADWNPRTEGFPPYEDGLPRELTEAVAADPDHFAEVALPLRQLRPALERGLLDGWRSAAAQGKSFRWERVLSFASTVLTRTDVNDEGRWTRSSIVDLLSSGLRDGQGQLPISLRADVWALLSRLTDDTDPTPEREAEAFRGGGSDPLDVAVNSVRGRAFEAAVQYGLWIRRAAERAGDNERIRRGFLEIPEIRDVLARHLNPEIDSSPAIRSVYGRWFPWIALLDPEWARSHVPAIFPVRSEHARLRAAAWDTYVTFCPAYNDVLPLLVTEFRRVIDELPTLNVNVNDSRDPSRHLAEHLMTYYWRRQLGLEPEGLVARFFAVAPEAVAARALEYVGNSLHQLESVLSPEDRSLMEELWRWRWDAITKNPGTRLEEYAAFGWWFASGKFDPAWALAQLEAILRVAPAEPETLVAEELARVAPAYPLQATRCLRALINASRDAWVVMAIRDEIRTVIGSAFRSSDRAAHETARELLDHLGASGHLEFRDLLPDSRPG